VTEEEVVKEKKGSGWLDRLGVEENMKGGKGRRRWLRNTYGGQYIILLHSTCQGGILVCRMKVRARVACNLDLMQTRFLHDKRRTCERFDRAMRGGKLLPGSNRSIFGKAR
jgi:hypothetical protein